MFLGPVCPFLQNRTFKALSVGGDFVDLGDVAAELGAHGGHDAQDVVGAAARGLTCVQCGRGGRGRRTRRGDSRVHGPGLGH